MAAHRMRVWLNDRIIHHAGTHPDPPRLFHDNSPQIIMVSRSGCTKFYWTTLSATELTVCRPAGKSLTCPTMGAFHPHIDDQLWLRRDAGTCAYTALCARKLLLAMAACVQNSVHENFFTHQLGPFMWAVISRGIITLHLD